METREEHYASMMQAITRYAPSADLEVIQRAYEYADEKHKNQLRKSGEPYIIHPLAVAEIVAEIGLDTDAIHSRAAARLSGRHRRELRGDLPHVRRDRSKPRRGRHEAHARAVFHDGRAADGKSAQDVHGHVEGHPGHPHQDRRPAAQYPHPAVPDARQADLQVHGDDGGLCASGPPARHAEDQVGAGGHCRCSTSIPRAIRRSSTTCKKNEDSAQQLHERHPVEDHRPSGLRGHPRRRSTAGSSIPTPSTARCARRTRRSTSCTTCTRSA